MKNSQITSIVSFDALESRTLRSVSLSNGGLFINGTNNADNIVIGMNDAHTQVFINVNNEPQKVFDVADFRYVKAFLLNGNDKFAGAVYGTFPIVVDGGDGNDTLEGGGGDDSLYGGAGNDVMYGKLGADFFGGGADFDTVSYEKSYGGVGVVVSKDGKANDGMMVAGSVNPYSNEGDNVNLDVEGIVGTALNDYITGGPNTDVIVAGRGDDTVLAGAGNDQIDGGDGKDFLFGEAGNDDFYGQAGRDFFFGGADIDTVHYDDSYHSSTGQGVVAQLVDGSSSNANGIAGESDQINNDIENLVGSIYNDRLYGNNKPNGIGGRGGNDRIYGFGGDDWLNGDDGNDSIYGGNNNDLMWGGQGNDEFHGEAGMDEVRYDDDYHNLGQNQHGVAARLAMSAASPSRNNGSADNDAIFFDVENMVGSRFNDVLSGNNLSNWINGADGDDTLFGYDGDDYITGGAGRDKAYGMNGNDTFFMKDGVQYNDFCDGQAGQDTVIGLDANDPMVNMERTILQ